MCISAEQQLRAFVAPMCGTNVTRGQNREHVTTFHVIIHKIAHQECFNVTVPVNLSGTCFRVNRPASVSTSFVKLTFLRPLSVANMRQSVLRCPVVETLELALVLCHVFVFAFVMISPWDRQSKHLYASSQRPPVWYRRMLPVCPTAGSSAFAREEEERREGSSRRRSSTANLVVPLNLSSD